VFFLFLTCLIMVNYRFLSNTCLIFQFLHFQWMWSWIEINKNSMIFLLAYLYVHFVTFLYMVMYMHIKRMNTFGNWLICCNFLLSSPDAGIFLRRCVSRCFHLRRTSFAWRRRSWASSTLRYSWTNSWQPATLSSASRHCLLLRQMAPGTIIINFMRCPLCPLNRFLTS